MFQRFLLALMLTAGPAAAHTAPIPHGHGGANPLAIAAAYLLIGASVAIALRRSKR